MLKSDLMQNTSNAELSLSVDQSTISSMVYRLVKLSIPILCIVEDNLLEECCRLAALLLLWNISSHFSIPCSTPSDSESQINITNTVQKLHTALVRNSYYKSWLLFKPLLNWVVALAAISTSSEEMKNDFLCLLAYAGRLMELKGWSEALITAGNMLWVGEVFDERFHNITEGFSWGKISMTINKPSSDMFSSTLLSLFSEETPQRDLQTLRLYIWKFIIIPRLRHSLNILIPQASFERVLQLLVHVACICIFLRYSMSLGIRTIRAGIFFPLNARDGIYDFFPAICRRRDAKCAAWCLGTGIGFKQQYRSNSVFRNAV